MDPARREELRRRLREKRGERNSAAAIAPKQPPIDLMLSAGITDMSVLKAAGQRGKQKQVLAHLQHMLSQAQRPSGSDVVVDDSSEEEGVPEPLEHVERRHRPAVEVDPWRVVEDDENKARSDLEGGERLARVESDE